MAGGWASALGAAILQGNQGYQQSKEFQNKLATDALQQALLRDQVNELPKKHAEGDISALQTILGDNAQNDPRFQKAVATAIGPGNNNNPDVALRNVQRQVQAKALNEYLTPAPVDPNTVPAPSRAPVFSDPRSQAAYAALGAEPPKYDPAEQAARQKYQSAKTMSEKNGIPFAVPEPNLTESTQHKLWTQQVEALIKAQTPAPMMQRVVGGMNEMVDNLSTAQKELERMYPGIESPDDPTKQPWQQPYNGLTDLAKAKAARTAYNFMDTPYNKAIQATSLANVQGWNTIVPGRINQAIVTKLGEHQSAFGNETPRATYMRNKELINLVNRNRADLMGGAQPGAGQAAPADAPSSAAPPAAPATPTAPPAKAVAPPVDVSQPIKVSEIQANMKPGEQLPQLIQELKSQGVPVVDDTKKGETFTDWNSVPTARRPIGTGATGIEPVAPAAPYTIGSLLQHLGLRQ